MDRGAGNSEVRRSIQIKLSIPGTARGSGMTKVMTQAVQQTVMIRNGRTQSFVPLEWTEGLGTQRFWGTDHVLLLQVVVVHQGAVLCPGVKRKEVWFKVWLEE